MNVAYDIDDTLLKFDGSVIEPVFEQLKRDFYNGYNIYIITARMYNQFIIDLTKDQLNKTGIDQYIKGVIFTSGKSKVPALQQLNIVKFYDDADYNIKDIINNINKLQPNFQLYHVIYSNVVNDYVMLHVYTK